MSVTAVSVHAAMLCVLDNCLCCVQSQSVGKLSWDRPSVTESQKDSFAAAVKANK